MSLAAYVSHGSHGGHGEFAGPTNVGAGSDPVQLGEFGYNFASIPHSAMLSSALRSARGSIVGAGTTQVDENTFPNAVPDSASLKHLDMYPRSAVLDWELLSGFEIEPIVGNAAGDGGDRVILKHRAADGTKMPFFELIAPGKEVFKEQIVHLGNAAGEREGRMDEINIQLADLTSFYTGLTFLHPARQPHLMEFVRAALRFCVMVEFRIKHAFTCPRPVAYSSAILPIIQTPSHSTLPSGHATEAFFLSTLFQRFYALSGGGSVSQHKLHCEKMAARIAHNRTVAGVHFPVDSAAGSILGKALAEYVVARFVADNTALSGLTNQKCDTRQYGGARFEHGDFTKIIGGEQPQGSDGQILYNKALPEAPETPDVSRTPIEKNAQLSWLWDECVTEITQGNYQRVASAQDGGA